MTTATQYEELLETLEAIEDADRYEGDLRAVFEDVDGDRFTSRLTPERLKLVVRCYRELEKELKAAEDKLDALKSRISDTLEDF